MGRSGFLPCRASSFKDTFRTPSEIPKRGPAHIPKPFHFIPMIRQTERDAAYDSCALFPLSSLPQADSPLYGQVPQIAAANAFHTPIALNREGTERLSKEGWVIRAKGRRVPHDIVMFAEAAWLNSAPRLMRR